MPQSILGGGQQKFNCASLSFLHTGRCKQNRFPRLSSHYWATVFVHFVPSERSHGRVRGDHWTRTGAHHWQPRSAREGRTARSRRRVWSRAIADGARCCATGAIRSPSLGAGRRACAPPSCVRRSRGPRAMDRIGACPRPRNTRPR